MNGIETFDFRCKFRNVLVPQRGDILDHLKHGDLYDIMVAYVCSMHNVIMWFSY